MDRTFTKMWRWSLLSATAVGAFWLVVYLLNGSVPSENTVGFLLNRPLFTLNFSVSRWFDLLIGPIWLSILIFWLDKKPNFGERIRYGGAVGYIEYFLWLAVVYSFINALLMGILTGITTAVLACLGVMLLGLLFLFGRLVVNWASAK